MEKSRNTITVTHAVPENKISTKAPSGSRPIGKRKYWAIFENKNTVYEGTFSECWTTLIASYSQKTLRELSVSGVKIARNG